MTVIGANPGLSQMAVAKRLGIERARLVHLLDSLEHRDLVSRIRSATDRRSHALHLTARGRTALAQFRRLAAEHERHVADKIGKENRAAAAANPVRVHLIGPPPRLGSRRLNFRRCIRARYARKPSTLIS